MISKNEQSSLTSPNIDGSLDLSIKNLQSLCQKSVTKYKDEDIKALFEFIIHGDDPKINPVSELELASIKALDDS